MLHHLEIEWGTTYASNFTVQVTAHLPPCPRRLWPRIAELGVHRSGPVSRLQQCLRRLLLRRLLLLRRPVRTVRGLLLVRRRPPRRAIRRRRRRGVRLRLKSPGSEMGRAGAAPGAPARPVPSAAARRGPTFKPDRFTHGLCAWPSIALREYQRAYQARAHRRRAPIRPIVGESASQTPPES